jgi:hypothetical protein
MLLQVAFDCMKFVWGGRAKASLVIDKDELRVLKMDNHVWSMSVIDINKTQRHRDQIGIGPIQLRAEVDAGLRAIATGELDHLDTTMQVERNKMTGCAPCLIMPDEGVYLEGAWATILEIVQGRAPPAYSQ